MNFVDPKENQAPIQTQYQTKVDPLEGFHEITELPSKFKLYPENTKIYAKPLDVLQNKDLTTINDSNINNIMTKVLRRSIKGISIQDLLVVDKLYFD